MKIKKFVWVTFSKVGFHYFERAGTEAQFADVSYLANNHRHKFGFKVWVEVFKNDRDIEFHQLLNYCELLFNSGDLKIKGKSVEMLANDLHVWLLQNQNYSGRDISIQVDEDGECGCLIHYTNN